MLRLLRLSLGYKAVLVQAWKGFHDIVSDWLELKLRLEISLWLSNKVCLFVSID